MKKCPKCGAKLQKGRRRCPECGEFVARRKSKGLLEKPALIYGGIAAVAILVVVLIFAFAGGEKKNTLYVKDMELSLLASGSNKEVELTNKLVYEKSMDQFDLEYMANHYYSKLVKKSKNGDRIYYPSNIIRLSNFTLTYRDLDEKDGEIVFRFDDKFGVCGTGLESKKVYLGEYAGNMGIYDNDEKWSFITIDKDFVIINQSGDWWDDYEVEIMEILSTIEIE